jgi:hypothetical protein
MLLIFDAMGVFLPAQLREDEKFLYKKEEFISALYTLNALYKRRKPACMIRLNTFLALLVALSDYVRAAPDPFDWDSVSSFTLASPVCDAFANPLSS